MQMAVSRRQHPGWRSSSESQKKSSVLQGRSDPKTLNRQESLLASVICRKHGDMQFRDDCDFYELLLLQLNVFEQDFGKFIDRQFSDNGKEGKCKRERTKEALDALCALNKVVK